LSLRAAKRPHTDPPCAHLTLPARGRDGEGGGVGGEGGSRLISPCSCQVLPRRSQAPSATPPDRSRVNQVRARMARPLALCYREHQEGVLRKLPGPSPPPTRRTSCQGSRASAALAASFVHGKGKPRCSQPCRCGVAGKPGRSASPARFSPGLLAQAHEQRKSVPSLGRRLREIVSMPPVWASSSKAAKIRARSWRELWVTRDAHIIYLVDFLSSRQRLARPG